MSVTIYKGNPVSKGIAVGKVFLYRPFLLEVSRDVIPGQQVPAELQRYRNALLRAGQELDELQARLRRSGLSNQAEIFAAHREIVDDPAITEDTERIIQDECVSAEWAVHCVLDQFIRLLNRKAGPIRERIADLRDVEQRILRCLAGVPEQNLAALTKPVVIVARDLMPSDTASLNKEMVLAIVTEEGGPTSHSAIIARGMEIPAILGIANAMELFQAEQTVLVDALKGEVILDPSDAQIADGNARKAVFMEHLAEVKAYLHKTPTTKDGQRVEVELNISSVAPQELENIAVSDGVGLFRTEFLYLGRDKLPDEEEQFETYKKALLACGQRPMILRTLDIGGDKKLTSLQTQQEENPFLGVRALRLCFAHPDVFRTQLRAALRAGIYGNLWLMFPMVGSLDDIVRARAAVDQVKAELVQDGIAFGKNVKLGIMIEIPSVAILADEVAKMVDFASIGTNDLTQYTLAVDRTNPNLSEYFQIYHPAVLRLIQMVADAFNKAGKPLGVCGELGGDRLAAAVLMGLGIHRLSMSISAVASIKKLVCTHSMEEFRAIAAKALTFTTSSEISDYLNTAL